MTIPALPDYAYHSAPALLGTQASQTRQRGRCEVSIKTADLLICGRPVLPHACMVPPTDAAFMHVIRYTLPLTASYLTASDHITGCSKTPTERMLLHLPWELRFDGQQALAPAVDGGDGHRAAGGPRSGWHADRQGRHREARHPHVVLPVVHLCRGRPFRCILGGWQISGCDLAARSPLVKMHGDCSQTDVPVTAGV